MSVWNEPSAKNAFILSVVSVLLTFIAAFVGIAYYMLTGSSLTLVFGLENVVVRILPEVFDNDEHMTNYNQYYGRS